MEIGILTWLHNGNYGTVLQAYALQRYLRDKGYEVHNLDYAPSALEKVLNLLKSKNSPSLFLEKWENYLTRKKASHQKLESKYKKFDVFLENNFHLTDRIISPKQIKSYSDRFEVFICGSDQIWSPMLFNPVYYFDFVDDSKIKISYACSFGVSEIPDNKRNVIKGLLQRYTNISVREQEGCRIVYKLLEQQVPVVVDPVFLLEQSEWDKIAAEKLLEEDYIFAYFLSNNDEHVKIAMDIAGQYNLKLVLVPVTKEQYDIDAILVEDAGPEEWISLIKHAKIVLTDSFHGSVFSLIYEKKLMIFKRFSDNSKKSQNSRIYTLIKQYGLEDWLVSGRDRESYLQNLEDKYDTKRYKAIKECIRCNSDDSKKWLLECICKNSYTN